MFCLFPYQMIIYIHNCVCERACMCVVVEVVDIMFAGFSSVDLVTFAKDRKKNIQVGCLLGKC